MRAADLHFTVIYKSMLCISELNKTCCVKKTPINKNKLIRCPKDYQMDPFLVLNDSQSGRDRRRGGAELGADWTDVIRRSGLAIIRYHALLPLFMLHVGRW